MIATRLNVIEKASDSASGAFFFFRFGPIIRGMEGRMTLPQFLLLIAVLIVAAGITVWALAASGLPLPLLLLAGLGLAGAVRLWARVE